RESAGRAGRSFLNEHCVRERSHRRSFPTRRSSDLAFQDIPAHDAVTQEIRRTLAANGMRDGVHIRLTLTRGVKYTSGMDPRLNRSEEHTSELQSRGHLVCRLLLEKKNCNFSFFHNS